jgi:type IV pilus assembly protein PilA
MLLQNIRAKIGARLSGQGEEGFTLIELLVVMLILGILAAIAIPAFFNQKEKAHDSSAKEEAHTAQIAMETCSTENNGEYGSCEITALKNIEKTLGANGNEVTVTSGLGKEAYEVNVKDGSTSNVFSIKRLATGKVYFPCTAKGNGGCPSSGFWSGEAEPATP